MNCCSMSADVLPSIRGTEQGNHSSSSFSPCLGLMDHEKFEHKKRYDTDIDSYVVCV